MGIVIDLIIVLIIGLCVFIGYKKGLTKCLLKLVTSIIAIVVAVVLYKPLVNFVIHSTTIDENIQLSLEKVMNNSIENNESGSLEVVKEDSGIPKPIAEYLNANFKEAVNTKKEEAVTFVARQTTLLIVNIACVIIIYLVAKILLRILTVLIDIVAKLPILKQFNEIGGLIYGIVESVFIIWIAMTVVTIITPLTGAYEIANFILESNIGSFFYNNNIFLNLIF